ncbi:hypothetical protein JAAARDRAFT_199076 [Jaapia argillacea MUCL 33604]|uniref:Alpha/beta hydrolase fold-3 domain-containing protein n=1 Tax=Jaapia argillacea MUCL 33604 TaxID=933084 RepID=A0A067PKD1_9AGAM|nr:hypothetical protein JAAARDRAFT_199076 [Jaapia argillacea MUCL 33604]
MAPINKKQPYEALYAVSLLTSYLIRVPYWVLISLLPSTRPRPSWTFFEAFIVHSNKFLFFGRCLPDGYQPEAVDVADIPEQKTLKKSHVVVIPPAKEKYLAGMATIDPSIVPISIPGYFFGDERERTKALPGEKVWLLAHGGGYFDAHARENGWPCVQVFAMLRNSKTDKVLTFEYRLAPQAPWPAPLLDAISAYAYLVDDCGFEPQNIMIGGDSAGGHLALALARYLRDEKTLPMPKCLLLNSPWSDFSVDAPAIDSDVLDMVAHGPVIRKLFAANGTIRHTSNPPSATPTIDFSSPYFSPASTDSPPGSFTGFPTTLITYGSAEAMMPEIMRLKEKMQGDGVDVATVVGKDGMHDFVNMEFWNAKKRHAAWADIGRWVDKTLVGAQ